MSQRKPDTVRIESSEGGSFDIFNSLSIANDLTTVSEAAFEVGDDGTWAELETLTRLGAQFKVFVNERLRLTGRVELNDIPIDPSSGAITRFSVRTKLADAMYASAAPNVKVKGSTIKDFILYLWEPLGITEADFQFNANVSRDLMTGVDSDGKKPTVAMEEIKLEQAKVNPPETIFQATDKHLRRHGLMLWDSPDGKLVIGSPDDQQTPQYKFKMYGDSRGAENNVLSATRTKDWSGIPGILCVAGTGGKQEWTKAKVRGFAQHEAINEAGFYRPVLLVNEAAKTDALAIRQAERELTARSMRYDTWTIKVDGLSYWNGSSKVSYGVDTVAEVYSTVAGGPNGAYLVHRIVMSRNASEGDTTELTMIKRGIWRT